MSQIGYYVLSMHNYVHYNYSQAFLYVCTVMCMYSSSWIAKIKVILMRSHVLHSAGLIYKFIVNFFTGLILFVEMEAVKKLCPARQFYAEQTLQTLYIYSYTQEVQMYIQ